MVNIKAIMINGEIAYCEDILSFDREYVKSYGAEAFATRIMYDPKIKKVAIFLIANMLMLNKAILAQDTVGARVDAAGWKILNIARSIGYWICIVMCTVEIIKCVMEGDTKNISKIMMRYCLAFAALYFMPWMLDLIKDIFVSPELNSMPTGGN